MTAIGCRVSFRMIFSGRVLFSTCSKVTSLYLARVDPPLDADRAFKKLDKIMNTGMEDFPPLNQRLLHDRHTKWAPQIERMLADGRTHVVVVGSAHLVGKDSVVAMLRAKGIKVEGP